jgi:hypothetical protein
MYIESVPNRSSPPAILLRESYREAGKVKKRTLLNLSDWPHERIAGFKALPCGNERMMVIALWSLGMTVPPLRKEYSKSRRKAPISSLAASSVSEEAP